MALRTWPVLISGILFFTWLAITRSRSASYKLKTQKLSLQMPGSPRKYSQTQSKFLFKPKNHPTNDPFFGSLLPPLSASTWTPPLGGLPWPRMCSIARTRTKNNGRNLAIKSLRKGGRAIDQVISGKRWIFIIFFGQLTHQIEIGGVIDWLPPSVEPVKWKSRFWWFIGDTLSEEYHPNFCWSPSQISSEFL